MITHVLVLVSILTLVLYTYLRCSIGYSERPCSNWLPLPAESGGQEYMQNLISSISGELFSGLSNTPQLEVTRPHKTRVVTYSFRFHCAVTNRDRMNSRHIRSCEAHSICSASYQPVRAQTFLFYGAA